MKEQLLEFLDTILESESSIKNHIDKVAEIRTQLDPFLDNMEKFVLSNKFKSRVQKEINTRLDFLQGSGTVLGATGIGKSKIVVDRVSRAIFDSDAANPLTTTHQSLIVVPTIKLRDVTWKEEFMKWNKGFYYDNLVTMVCYDSLPNMIGMEFRDVYLDECHNITPTHEPFLEQHKGNIVCLTATKPRDEIKLAILRKYCPQLAFTLSVDEAVKLGIVAPYNITVITIELDKEKNISIKKKDGNTFMTSEFAQYGYMTAKAYGESGSAFDLIRRRHLLINLRSKTLAAKQILSMIPQDKKMLIFCGSKDQADELCEHRFYSKPTAPRKPGEKAKPEAYDKYQEKLSEYMHKFERWQHVEESLRKFVNDEILRMSCVDALNEGQNIDNMDYGFMPQVDSNPLNFTQRVGRTIRFRPEYIGEIIILCAADTEDVKWVKKATAEFYTSNIRWVSFADIISGKEQLIIN